MTAHGDTLWTIGHSTRAWDVFVSMLGDEAIELLVDVRRFAGSRRNPQFSGENMMRALPDAGIDYLAMVELGGRRTPRRDSPNTAWRNASFRGYADYMDTPEFAAACARLGMLAGERRTAVMCAEAMWWQCHRALIADRFKASGWQVVHLLAPGRNEPHPYTSAARLVEGRLDYSLPGSGQQALFE